MCYYGEGLGGVDGEVGAGAVVGFVSHAVVVECTAAFVADAHAAAFCAAVETGGLGGAGAGVGGVGC